MGQIRGDLYEWLKRRDPEEAKRYKKQIEKFEEVVKRQGRLYTGSDAPESESAKKGN